MFRITFLLLLSYITNSYKIFIFSILINAFNLKHGLLNLANKKKPT